MTHLSPEQQQQLINALLAIGAPLAIGIGTVITGATPFVAAQLLVGLKNLWNRGKTEKEIAQIESLEEAIKPGVSSAVQAVKRGSTYDVALKAGLQAVWDALKSQGKLSGLIQRYGSEGVLKDSIVTMVERDLVAKHGVKDEGAGGAKEPEGVVVKPVPEAPVAAP